MLRKDGTALWGVDILILATVAIIRELILQLPKFMELVGLGYTAWFVYRYLLFKV